ncbi:HAD family phosphatase [Methylophilus sp. Q8]|uniref:HAD family hydrolase n=1 Tax=Methylophilus sp. Q8 TaxID=1506586 RepID=UPI0006487C89|nr:HAD family hydrolase [Methylophilus sp. Q8]
MQAVELIIFDCDGVLVDSELIVNRVFLEALNRAGVPITLNHLLERFVGHSLEQCLTMVHDQYGVALGSNFVAEYKVKRDLALAQQVRAVDGVEALINQLTIPFCVASNSEAQKVHTMLTLTGLIGYFAGKILSATDMSKPKPAPDVYLKAAAMFGVSPAHCLVIEDTPTGVKAAVAAGMPVFGYAALTPQRILLQAGAARTFFSMTEIQQTISDLLIKETS